MVYLLAVLNLDNALARYIQLPDLESEFTGHAREGVKLSQRLELNGRWIGLLKRLRAINFNSLAGSLGLECSCKRVQYG
jgi:hypothetical protein